MSRRFRECCRKPWRWAPILDLKDGELGYGQGLILAPPWPRQLPELPKERNFQGVSFAVSHVTGIAAKILSEMEDVDAGELVVHLRRYAMRK